jgi:hypothetical protein
VIQTTGIIVSKTTTTTKTADTITTNNNMTVAIKTINAMIALVAKRRAARKSPTRRKMIASAITSRRKVMGPCITTCPCYHAQILCLEKGVAPVQGLLLAHAPVLALAQAAATGAMQTIMSPMMTSSQADPSSASICTLRIPTMDITIVPRKAVLFLPPLLLQKQKRTSVLPNRKLRQQSKKPFVK